MTFTRQERRLIRACQDQAGDTFGECADRVNRIIDDEAGVPLSDTARWNTIIDLVRKLTPKKYLSRLAHKASRGSRA